MYCPKCQVVYDSSGTNKDLLCHDPRAGYCCRDLDHYCFWTAQHIFNSGNPNHKRVFTRTLQIGGVSATMLVGTCLLNCSAGFYRSRVLGSTDIDGRWTISGLGICALTLFQVLCAFVNIFYAATFTFNWSKFVNRYNVLNVVGSSK